MASKTANVLARVEPSVKEQAESIITQLGIPASVVINMLYKQIILTKGIPFDVDTGMNLSDVSQLHDSTFHLLSPVPSHIESADPPA